MNATHRLLRRVAGPACLVVTFVALTWWSWNRWADPLVDFGRELYTPWQLAQGRVLSQDVATIFGPLSPYANACCFAWFGTGLWTLQLCNLFILAFLTVLLYGLVSQLGDRATATMACYFQLTVFSFSQYFLEGNYNFVAPYAHEATHGLVLTMAVIAGISQYLRRGSAGWLAISGLCCGLAILTKLEMALAAVLSATCGMILVYRHRRAIRVTRWGWWAFGAGSALPTIAFLAYFLTHMPVKDALAVTCGAWRGPGTSHPWQQAFYQRIAGLDRPVEHLIQLMAVFLGGALILAALVVLDRASSRSSPGRWLARGIAAISVGVAGFYLLPWWDVPRPLPVVALASAAWWIRRSWSRTLETGVAVRGIPLAMWSVAASVLLLKTLLWTRWMHYGFCLSLPATLLLIVWLLHDIPSYLARRPQGGEWFRLAAAALLIAASFAYWQRASHIYALKTTRITGPYDSFYALTPKKDPRVGLVTQTLPVLQAQMQPGDTLAVIPEGVMLNFLTRRPNPTPYLSYLPLEMSLFGESRVLEAWQRHPPTWVVLWPRDLAEYHVGSFGDDQTPGHRLLAWIRERYRRIHRIGSRGTSGVEVWKREEAGVLRKEP